MLADIHSGLCSDSEILQASSFPFDETKSAILPPSGWLESPFSGFLAIWLFTELRMTELRSPSKYVEQGKYWAQCPFHPEKGKISFSIYLMEHYMHVSNISLVPIFITFLEINIQKEISISSWFKRKEMSQKRELNIDAFVYLDFKRLISTLFTLMKDTTPSKCRRN